MCNIHNYLTASCQLCSVLYNSQGDPTLRTGVMKPLARLFSHSEIVTDCFKMQLIPSSCVLVFLRTVYLLFTSSFKFM